MNVPLSWLQFGFGRVSGAYVTGLIALSLRIYIHFDCFLSLYVHGASSLFLWQYPLLFLRVLCAHFKTDFLKRIVLGYSGLLWSFGVHGWVPLLIICSTVSW